ncbi:MAG: HTH-type transcriptional regulator Xre [Firmicutes bacterium ADurb.Bin300]|nr:MAG: HTH-type transcriptional regulator Xre [Firmicutes bacterium ADurb.Bin300]
MGTYQNKFFATRFQKLRTEMGLTQEELLAQFNKIFHRALTAAAISQYENAKRIPEISTLIDFASFFKVSVDYLLGVDTKIEPNKKEDSKIDELSPESQQKAIEYIEMLKTLEEVETGKNCIDFREKA